MLGSAVSCSDPLPPPAARAELVALPNGLAIEASGARVRAVDAGGALRWSVTLPGGDVVVAPVSAARNSTTYVRGARGLYAVAPSGEVAWSHPLEPSAIAPDRTHIYATIALADSGVALVVGRKSVLSLESTGKERFTEEIPAGDLVSAPRALGSGHLLVPTTTGLYAYTPSGSVEWHLPP